MENIGDAWHAATASRIGAAIARLRKDVVGLTAQQLAERCGDLGVPIHRTTITKIENGRPRFDLGELIVIAAALGVPPVLLIYPDYPFGELVDVLPGRPSTQLQAASWFAGEAQLDEPQKWIEVDRLSEVVSELMHTARWQEANRPALLEKAADPEQGAAVLDFLVSRNLVLTRRIAQLWELLHGEPAPKDDLDEAEDWKRRYGSSTRRGDDDG